MSLCHKYSREFSEHREKQARKFAAQVNGDIWRYYDAFGQRIFSVRWNDPDAEGDYDLDRLAVMCNQRMSMRDEVSERFSLTKDIPLDRLRELVEAEKEDRYIIMKEPRRAGVHRLTELAEADREGRCVVLPCKRDDVLWTFHTYPFKRVYSFHVTDISTLNGRTMLNTDIMGVVDARDVGKTVFLTRDAAEEALKAREQSD